jgi:hypothetical protein
MRERTAFNSRERRSLFREALQYGKSPASIDNKDFQNYLLSKPNCKVKVYKGYVFIYSKNSKQLYTMYEIPKKYKENINV